MKKLKKQEAPRFIVELKDGVERTAANLETLAAVQKSVDQLYNQHENNLAMLEVIQKVADGEMTDEQAKLLISTFTTNVATVVDNKP